MLCFLEPWFVSLRSMWDSGGWTGWQGKRGGQPPHWLCSPHKTLNSHSPSSSCSSAASSRSLCHPRGARRAEPKSSFSTWVCRSVSGSYPGVGGMSCHEHHSLPLRISVIQTGNVQSYLSRTFCQPFLLSNIEPKGLVERTCL